MGKVKQSLWDEAGDVVGALSHQIHGKMMAKSLMIEVTEYCGLNEVFSNFPISLFFFTKIINFLSNQCFQS